MRSQLLPYARLLAAGYRRRTHYRLALFAGVITNTAFGLIRASVLLAMLAGAGGTVGAYTSASLITYMWLGQGLLGPLNLWGSREMTERIRSGDIAIDLARPIDVQLAGLAHDLGLSLAAFLPRTLPTLAVGAVTFGLTLPTSALTWLAGLTAVLAALVISYLSRFLLQSIAFWVVETRGLEQCYVGAATVLSGLIVPVHLFPDGLRTAAYLSPFPWLIQGPVDILTGLRTGSQATLVLAAQLAWIVALLAAGHLALRAGTRRLVVQGG